MALELKGDPDEAIAEYQRASELNDDPSGLAFVAHAKASMGQQNEARAVTGPTGLRSRRRVTSPVTAFALVHLALGEKDQALDWLEKDAREQTGF